MDTRIRHAKKKERALCQVDQAEALFLWCTGESIRRIAREVGCPSSYLLSIQKEMDKQIL